MCSCQRNQEIVYFLTVIQMLLYTLDHWLPELEILRSNVSNHLKTLVDFACAQSPDRHCSVCIKLCELIQEEKRNIEGRLLLLGTRNGEN